MLEDFSPFLSWLIFLVNTLLFVILIAMFVVCLSPILERVFPGSLFIKFCSLRNKKFEEQKNRVFDSVVLDYGRLSWRLIPNVILFFLVALSDLLGHGLAAILHMLISRSGMKGLKPLKPRESGVPGRAPFFKLARVLGLFMSKASCEKILYPSVTGNLEDYYEALEEGDRKRIAICRFTGYFRIVGAVVSVYTTDLFKKILLKLIP